MQHDGDGRPPIFHCRLIHDAEKGHNRDLSLDGGEKETTPRKSDPGVRLAATCQEFVFFGRRGSPSAQRIEALRAKTEGAKHERPGAIGMRPQHSVTSPELFSCQAPCSSSL